MKRIHGELAVTVSGCGPRLIRRGRHTYRVLAVLDEWAAKTRWWSEEEEERVYYELLTDRGVIEVYRRGAEWRIAKIHD